MPELPMLSFILPALNERENIAGAVRGVVAAAQGRLPDFEVLVVDDGSTDGTSGVADQLARADPRVRALHNATRLGYGASFFRGAEAARGESVMLVPGDGEVPEEAVARMLDARTRADIVLPVVTGSSARPLLRRAASRAFVLLLNLLFGRRVSYYTGHAILPRRALLSVPFRDPGHTFMAVPVVCLLRSGFTCVEVEAPLRYRAHGSSKALSVRNVALALCSLAWLVRWAYWERGRVEPSGPPARPTAR